MAMREKLIAEIIVELEKGTTYKQCFAVIRSKSKLVESTFASYWKKANVAHTEAQQAIKEQLAALDTQNAIEAKSRHIADVNERKEILTKIMRGEIPLTKPMIVDGVIELVEVVPDWMDRKNAISELNKMEGDYAATKVAQTNSKGEDVTNLSDNQFIQLINAVINAPSTDTGQ